MEERDTAVPACGDGVYTSDQHTGGTSMKGRSLPTWSVLALGLALATSTSVVAAQSAGTASSTGNTVMEQRMSPEEFKAAGMHKLSPQELAALHDWVLSHQGGVAVN